MHVPRLKGARKHKLHYCEVYVLGYASERAYGAVIFIKSIIDNAVTVRLICSKARQSPIKRVTLPRLELVAALVATRLLRYFCQATECDIYKATLCCDSAIALYWIRGDPKRWKAFVCNRVTKTPIRGFIVHLKASYHLGRIPTCYTLADPLYPQAVAPFSSPCCTIPP